MCRVFVYNFIAHSIASTRMPLAHSLDQALHKTIQILLSPSSLALKNSQKIVFYYFHIRFRFMRSNRTRFTYCLFAVFFFTILLLLFRLSHYVYKRTNAKRSFAHIHARLQLYTKILATHLFAVVHRSARY